ncbi:MAG: acetate--CoA ligase family protein [Burkholderiaceae bacterium]
MDTKLHAVIAPKSVAVVGASDNPDKIGGRPLNFMKNSGYKGQIFAINPRRDEVQGIKAYPDIKSLPQAPELAYIALAGDAAVQAVQDCADIGVKVALVIASGFGETGAPGLAVQQRMVSIANAAGMRVVGPNTQGLANFHTGAINSFSSLFVEMPPADGPVAVISQSGAMCSVAYGQLRERGIGVRYANATGNESDVTVSEMACAVAQDTEIKVILLYFESIADPANLARAAQTARANGITIIAIKAGRTSQGQRVASSHTGAMANEDRVVDAFFRRHGIWRAEDTHEQVRSVEMLLKGWQPTGRNLAIISNSGASCVIAADLAEQLNLPIAQLAPQTRQELADALPGFAATTNPIDITAALLSDSGLFGSVLPALAKDPNVQLVFINIPAAGAAYDVNAFARDTANFIKTSGLPVAVCAWQELVASVFRDAGVPTYRTAIDALATLANIAAQTEANQKTAPAVVDHLPKRKLTESDATPDRKTGFLSEADSLAALVAQSIPVVAHRLCRSADEAVAALTEVRPPVVVKACSPDIPHKSDYGLVALNLADEAQIRDITEHQLSTMRKMDAQVEGVIVAQMSKGRLEFMIGARLDPVFGPVVIVGMGGKYVEALNDAVVLLPPFTTTDVISELQHLQMAPIFSGVRGEAPLDLNALAGIAVQVGDWLLAGNDSGACIASIDLNPVLVNSDGDGAIVLDALIEKFVD